MVPCATIPPGKLMVTVSLDDNTQTWNNARRALTGTGIGDWNWNTTDIFIMNKPDPDTVAKITRITSEKEATLTLFEQDGKLMLQSMKDGSKAGQYVVS